MKDLQIGQIYYKVSFADLNLTIPRVEPMIFVGTNLFPEHEEQGIVTFYFRDPALELSVYNTEDSALEYYSCSEDRLTRFSTLVEVIAKLSLVAAGVDLTKPAGFRGLNQ